ncbi:hypothetical protein LZ30DRAFT_183930 [Colletotrichum cereale]|nr:hypothetical protein LZ30DRAFT_183930 [Colletotrichum cereale]
MTAWVRSEYCKGSNLSIEMQKSSNQAKVSQIGPRRNSGFLPEPMTAIRCSTPGGGCKTACRPDTYLPTQAERALFVLSVLLFAGAFRKRCRGPWTRVPGFEQSNPSEIWPQNLWIPGSGPVTCVRWVAYRAQGTREEL